MNLCGGSLKVNECLHWGRSLLLSTACYIFCEVTRYLKLFELEKLPPLLLFRACRMDALQGGLERSTMHCFQVSLVHPVLCQPSALSIMHTQNETSLDWPDKIAPFLHKAWLFWREHLQNTSLDRKRKKTQCGSFLWIKATDTSFPRLFVHIVSQDPLYKVGQGGGWGGGKARGGEASFAGVFFLPPLACKWYLQQLCWYP